MAYDERLATRVRKALARYKRVAEIRMMGGLCFTLNGNMFCGVLNGDLVVRVGREHYTTALAKPHTRPMDFTGRPIAGFVYVGSGGYKTDKGLKGWILQGVNFVKPLPAKRK